MLTDEAKDTPDDRLEAAQPSLAAAGWLSRFRGGNALVSATIAAALLYAAGCLVSASASEIFTFLAGRILQGIGGGWVTGVCSVSIGLLFANRMLPRVYSSVSSVWGVAVLVGPMLGGLFVAFGSWRAVFWAFGLRGAITAAAARIILPAAEPADGTKAIAWRRLSLIGIGIARIAIADLAGDFASLAGLAILGACTFLLALRQDSRSGVRLFSRGSGDPRTIHGAGYATLFLFYVASMGLTVYGPAVLQTLRGLSPLAAGYVVGAEALFWAAASLPMAGLTGRWGAVALFVGLACCAIVFDDGNLAWVVLAGGLVGVGSGLSYAFIGQGILSALSSDERATGGAGIATVRLTGAAVVQPLPRRSPIWPGSRTGFRCQRQGWLVSGCFLPRCRSRRWPALAPGTRVGRAPSVPSPQLY